MQEAVTKTPAKEAVVTESPAKEEAVVIETWANDSKTN